MAQDGERASRPRKLLMKHVLKKIFFEDWMLKLTALIITFALWFGVTGLSTPVTKRFTVPLMPSIATNVEITNAMIQDIDIVVSGDKRRVDQINRSDLIATIDLRDVAPGERVISLSPETVSVSLPQGIKLAEVQPSRVPVTLELVEEKDVEVKVVTSGEPAAGYEIYSVSVLPPRVRVRGPASYIRTLEYLETQPIDIDVKSGDFTARQIPVTVSNPKAAVFSTIVDVIFRIGERRIERSFSTPVPGSDGKTARFTLFGPATLLRNARAEDFRIEPGSGESAPQLVLPAEIRDRVEIRAMRIVP